MFRKIIEMLANKIFLKQKDELTKILSQQIKEELAEGFKNIVLKNSNSKPLSDTGLFITYYISIKGLSKAMAEQEIAKIANISFISEERINEMGVKFVTQQYIPIGDGAGGKTRIEIVTV